MATSISRLLCLCSPGTLLHEGLLLLLHQCPSDMHMRAFLLKSCAVLFWMYNTHLFLNIQWSSDALKEMKPVSTLIPAPVQRQLKSSSSESPFTAYARSDAPGTLTWCPAQAEQMPHRSIHQEERDEAALFSASLWHKPALKSRTKDAHSCSNHVFMQNFFHF